MFMEEALERLAVSAPDLLALVVIVVLFLKYMGKRDDLIKGLTDEHLSERKLQRDVIERNSVAAGVNTEALNNVAHILLEQANVRPVTDGHVSVKHGHRIS